MRNQSYGLVAGIAAVAIGAAIAVWQTSATTAQAGPFGGPEDIAYAETLWTELEKARLVGPDAIRSKFYEGAEPHGFALETFDTDLSIDGHKGRLLVKNNYGPEGIDPDEAAENPEQHLAAITVMFRREAGYDSDNQDWFWAKYLPGGSLDKNPAGVELAGRVAKGADQGCIACHMGADGEDLIFFTNRADR